VDSFSVLQWCRLVWVGLGSEFAQEVQVAFGHLMYQLLVGLKMAQSRCVEPLYLLLVPVASDASAELRERLAQGFVA